ncbi:MAG: alpha/beta hydrolase [Telluria sp.]
MLVLRRILPLVFAAMAAVQPLAATGAPLARPATGTIERIDMPSRLVDPRTIEVWLPDGYAERARGGQRFQVLYMHDGQMLFDPATTWNKQAWHVDVAMDRLARAGRIAPTIVVAIPNNGKYRASEYIPQKIVDRLAPGLKAQFIHAALEDRPQSDNYLRFIVTELKPLIDQRYATRPEPAATFIMGSSMGGLISVYAFCEYPQVFGGAAGLSTHWIGSFEANASIPIAAFGYLDEHLPAPAGRRLYLDHGTETLDALYGPSQAFVEEILRVHGYAPPAYLSRVYPGTNHSEAAWAERLDVPLQFLLGR